MTSKFNNTFDGIVQKTGAGTESFKRDIKKRLQKMWFITISNIVIALLNLLAIRNSWWPESDAFKVLAGFIFLLSAMLILMGLLGLFVVWFQGYTLNRMAEYNKKKNT